MAYTPINWQNGDTITAEKMNKMDNGWSVDSAQLFSETATTVAGEYGNEAELAYSTPITADTLIVTVGGVEYTCPSITMNDGKGYGGVDSAWSYVFSQYPFAIVSDGNTNYFATENVGTFTVSASAESVELSTNFQTAVNSSVTNANMIPFLCVDGTTTFAEAQRASSNGSILYFKFGDITHIITTLIPPENLPFIPTTTTYTASFINDIFTVSFN